MTTGGFTLDKEQIIRRAKGSHPREAKVIDNGKPMIHVYCVMTGDTMSVLAQPVITHRAGILAAGVVIIIAKNAPVSKAENRDIEAKRHYSSLINTNAPVKWIKK